MPGESVEVSHTGKLDNLVFPCDHDHCEVDEKKIKIIHETFPTSDWISNGYCDEKFLQTIDWHWLTFETPSEKIHTALAIIYGIIMIVGVFGNLLVISMFCRCRILRTPANYLILNLAISDFLIVAEIPLFIFNSIHRGPAIGLLGCQVYGFVGGLMGTASIMTLTMISIDRYYVIVYPLNPFKKTTHRRALVMIIFVWLYSMTFASVPIFLLNGYVPEGLLTSCSFDYLAQDLMSRVFVFVYFIAAWFVPLSLIIFCYVAIFRMVLQAEKFNEFHKDGNSRKTYKSSGRNEEKVRKELKIALITTVIILLWLSAWTPYALVALLGIFGQKHLITPLISSLPAVFCKTASCIDPFVYSINHPRFQRELVKFKIWTICTGKQRRNRGQSTQQQDTNTSHYVSATCVDNSEIDDVPHQTHIPLKLLQDQQANYNYLAIGSSSATGTDEKVTVSNELIQDALQQSASTTFSTTANKENSQNSPVRKLLNIEANLESVQKLEEPGKVPRIQKDKKISWESEMVT